MRPWIIIPQLIAFFLISFPANAEKVGTVRLVEIYGYGTLLGEKRRPLFERDDVILNMEIESVEKGRIDVRFKDKTQLIVGSLGKIKIDNFVFNPKESVGDLSLKVAAGVMRFVTGKMSSQSYKIRTPSAVLGVRGTDFTVSVAENGATTVSVLTGSVEIAPINGSPTTISAGATATTDGTQISTGSTTGLPDIARADFGISSSSAGGADGGGNDAGGDGGGGH